MIRKEMKKARINVENVSKVFRIGSKSNPALGRIISFLKGDKKKELRVLNNVNLTVSAGEIVGIIGKNGSGKSTLLRTIAGIYIQDSGKIETSGRVFYLSGFDLGLMPRLTMRENIFLVCSVLGLGQADIKKRFESIVDFSGLNDFVDTEVDKFSSGMASRLNFSITVHCIEHHSPDILLLDEVFGAGGDIDFQEKAAKKMEELIKSGAAVILVSHNLEIIKNYCESVVLLQNGRVVKKGNPAEIVEFYIK